MAQAAGSEAERGRRAQRPQEIPPPGWRDIAFSIYVRNFGSYNETYGSLGAVVILLMWAFVVLLGAYAADTVGHKP